MRYLVYECLTTNGKLADIKLTESQAIETQKRAAWKHNGYVYENDKFALNDFIESNRAFWREEL